MKIFFWVLISSSFFLLAGNTVSATTIFSPLLEIEINPGETQNGILKIFNETNANLDLKASLEIFKAGDETGQPIYLAAEEKDIFLNWFEIEQEELVLKPKQGAIVPFSIKAPANAIPGGYYAVIFWEKSINQTVANSQVGVNSKVGTLIFLKVKGDLVEAGEVVEFTLNPKKSLLFSLPVNFKTRISNTGNIHIKPTGEIKLKGMFGQEESFALNPSLKNVLPNSTRRFDLVWGQTLSDNIFVNFWSGLKQDFHYLALGKFKATLELSYGINDQKTITKEISFWLISYRLVIALVGIIFFLTIFFKFNKDIKRLKRRAQKTTK